MLHAWDVYAFVTRLLVLLFVFSGPGWRAQAHGRGDGRAEAAEHGLRVPVPPGGGQEVSAGGGLRWGRVGSGGDVVTLMCASRGRDEMFC